MIFGKLLKKIGAISLVPIISSFLYLKLSLCRTNILIPWRFEIERFYCISIFLLSVGQSTLLMVLKHLILTHCNFESSFVVCLNSLLHISSTHHSDVTTLLLCDLHLLFIQHSFAVTWKVVVVASWSTLRKFVTTASVLRNEWNKDLKFRIQ